MVKLESDPGPNNELPRAPKGVSVAIRALFSVSCRFEFWRKGCRANMAFGHGGEDSRKSNQKDLSIRCHASKPTTQKQSPSRAELAFEMLPSCNSRRY